jgi:hypothetical protein
LIPIRAARIQRVDAKPNDAGWALQSFSGDGLTRARIRPLPEDHNLLASRGFHLHQHHTALRTPNGIRADVISVSRAAGAGVECTAFQRQPGFEMLPRFFEQDRDDHQHGPGEYGRVERGHAEKAPEGTRCEDGGNDTASHADGRTFPRGVAAGNAQRNCRHFMSAEGLGRALFWAEGPAVIDRRLMAQRRQSDDQCRWRSVDNGREKAQKSQKCVAIELPLDLEIRSAQHSPFHSDFAPFASFRGYLFLFWARRGSAVMSGKRLQARSLQLPSKVRLGNFRQ